MERAGAIKALCDRFKMTHGEVAERLGIERPTVTNLLRMLELPEEIRQHLEDGLLNLGHAKILLPLSRQLQLNMAALAAKLGWSVRKLEEEVEFELERIKHGTAAAMSGKSGGVEAPKSDDADDDGSLHKRAIVADLEKQLGEHMGTKVKIKTDRTGKSGTIEIRFFDLDHFDGIVAMTGFAMK
jgi:ParB family chromosome partitioning protein